MSRQKKDWKKVVPIEFYNEKLAEQPHPEVQTVAELIEQLKRLPKKLTLDETYQIIVYNIDDDDPRVAIKDFY